MKNLLSLLLLAALPLLPVKADAKNHDSSSSDSSQCEKFDPEFGYFYITHDELVEGCFETVTWTDAGSVNTDDIFLAPHSIDQIILKKKGYYLATYTVTGFVSNPATTNTPTQGPVCCDKFQFALYLNEGDQPIPGSTYAGNTESVLGQSNIDSGPCVTEVVGQVIFRVNERNSVLQLVNQSENSVQLVSDAGTNNCSKFGPNVSASIAIQRLSNLQID